MKKTFIKYFLFLAILGSQFACSEKIDEAYLNPNAASRVEVEKILPQIISATVGNYAAHGTMHDVRYIGAYVQNFSFSLPNSNFDQMGHFYNPADIGQSIFRMHYFDIGQNNMRMIEWAEEEKKWDYAGVGQAIFGWSWLTIADVNAEVIVKEAFNTSQITFKYDTQEDAYNLARDYCFRALNNLNKTGDGVSQANLALGDAFMYNGDVNKWKKFVYGVLARYYNHFSNKSTYKADSAIFYSNLAMTDNADNAMVKFAATVLTANNNYWGPLRNNLIGTGVTNPTAVRQSAFIANLLNGTNTEFLGAQDPRAWYLLRGNSTGTIVGVEPTIGQASISTLLRPENFWGSSQAGPATNAAPVIESGRYLFRNSAPIPLMTASEMFFIKAEAAWRKGDKTTAYEAYKEGISKSFDLLSATYNVNIPAGREITAANKLAYMTGPLVVPATANGLNLSKIMLQKYISMFVHGAIETWMDMRRYHYTDADPATSNQVYRDFRLPITLFPDNAGLTVQRVRPRFNSEFVWNLLELQRIGATDLDYHVREMWITKP